MDIYEKYEKAKKQGIKLIDCLENFTNIDASKDKKFCVFFDIDDTLIDTSNGQNISPIYDLYYYALSKKISPIIITARSGDSNNINFTVKQLQQNNIKEYDLLYFRPEYMQNADEFKLFARRNANECGYIPLFSIGDMKWDVGLYGGIPILLQ